MQNFARIFFFHIPSRFLKKQLRKLILITGSFREAASLERNLFLRQVFMIYLFLRITHLCRRKCDKKNYASYITLRRRKSSKLHNFKAIKELFKFLTLFNSLMWKFPHAFAGFSLKKAHRRTSLALPPNTCST